MIGVQQLGNGYAIRTRRGPPPMAVVPIERVRPTIATIAALAAPNAIAAPIRPACMARTPEVKIWRAPVVTERPANPIPEGLREPINRFVRLVAEVYGISSADILGPRRVASIAKPRHVVCFLAKRFGKKTLPEIGRRLGGRDHTTALNSIRRVEAAVLTIGEPAEDTPEAWATHLWEKQAKW